MRLVLLFSACLLVSCSGYDAEVNALLADRRANYTYLKSKGLSGPDLVKASRTTPYYKRSLALVDSALSRRPRVRFWSDSLARVDSFSIARFHLFRIQHSYYTGDTTAAALGYIEAQDWLSTLAPSVQADEARRYAETAADAIVVDLSPNMARLAYSAFVRAEKLATTQRDTSLARLVDASRAAVRRHLMTTVPDSVLLAFAPSPASDEGMSWGVGVVIALVLGLAALMRGRKEDEELLPRAEILLRNMFLAQQKQLSLPVHLRVPSVYWNAFRSKDYGSVKMRYCLAYWMTDQVERADFSNKAYQATIAGRVRSSLVHYLKKEGVPIPAVDEWKDWLEARYEITRAGVRAKRSK